MQSNGIQNENDVIDFNLFKDQTLRVFYICISMKKEKDTFF